MRASVKTFYENDSAEESYCEVVIRDCEIVVSYYDDNGQPVIYKGVNENTGRWVLNCETVKGRATLNRSPLDKNCLEGSWWEAGCSGMWQIDLDDEE